MAVKSDSRNEVFLSALDLFTLLLFAFMGVAFQPQAGRANDVVLPLPVVTTSSKTRQASAESTAYFQWKSATDAQAHEGQECSVMFRVGKEEPQPIEQVSCWPGAFSRSGLQLNPRLLAVKKPGLVAAILCPKDQADLQACARLQWVVAEHGFDVVAAVRTEK